MKLVIVGGGAGGLLTGLLLAEDGHRVTILERDPQLPPDPSEAWDGWDRPGVTQFHQPHNLLTRFWTICDRDLPDLSASLLAIDGALTRSVDMRSPAIRDEPTTPEDERIKMVGIRRPIFEQAIARYAAHHSGISVVRGVAVNGLLTGSELTQGVPHIVGVTTEDGHEYRADLVIDAAGRRSPFARFAERLGVQVTETSESDGFTYFSRWFKMPDGLPKLTAPPIAGIAPGLLALLFPADDNYAGLAMVGPASNRDLRRLKDPERFMAMMAAMPTAADLVLAAASSAGQRHTHHGIDPKPPNPILVERPPDHDRGGQRRRRLHVHQPEPRPGHQPGSRLRRRTARGPKKRP